MSFTYKFKFFRKTLALTFCVIFFMAPNLHAGEKEDLTVLRNTVVNLLQNLVEQGIMSQEQANALVENAKQEAAKEVAQSEDEVPSDVVRVPYVPQIVKDEIRQQVREELRQEVVSEVVAHAKTERWGVKDSLPGWLNRIKISGDVRVRGQEDIYDDSNVEAGAGPYLDFQELNESGPFSGATLGSVGANGGQGFINTSENRTRQRIRARLNLDAKVSDRFSAGLRMTTGSTSNPVSTNQTLGEGGSPKDIVLDRAFIKYKARGDRDWLEMSAGRIANPWVSTDLVWDDDLNFEGVAGTLKFPIGGGDGLYALTENNKEIFLTMGAFPLNEFGRSSERDKWLLGGQIGTSLTFSNQSKLTLAAAYYDFKKVQADQSPRDFDEFEASAPESLQKGNSLFLLTNDPDGIPGNGDELGLFGLAPDFNMVNITGSLDLANFAPHHLILTADYVKNIGYDSDDVNDRVLADISEKTTGYHFRIDYGWPRVSQFGNWNVFAAYKYLERDAVFDAFTDSDFHLGGTDAQGWEMGGNYGIGQNTWLSLTWRSADEIDGPAVGGVGECGPDIMEEFCNLGIDVLQLDLNTKF